MGATEVGSIVRQLREAAGLTQGQLGERVGLRKDQVSKVEHGVRKLDVVEISLVAEALGATTRQLLGRQDVGTLALAARVSDSVSDEQTQAVTARARQLLELDHLLGELAVRQPAKISEQGGQLLAQARGLPKAASKAQANRDGKALAQRTRELLRLGSAPVGSLADLAERHFGVDVECGPFGTQVSGMCVHGDEIAIILANTHLTAGHLRFTLAHELAHHVLGDPREIVIESRLSGETTVERRANAFAAHLLMPVEEVQRVIVDRAVTDDVLAELMQYFQVSLSSLVNHLADCRVIRYDQQNQYADRSARWIVHQYGDPGKPDPTLEGQGVRPPVRLLSSARTAQRQGRIGATVVAALLGVAVDEVSQPSQPAETSGVDAGQALADFHDL
jgi:transcriptional regulator with XRE-family HTH domain